MRGSDPATLRQAIGAAGNPTARMLWGGAGGVALAGLANGSSLAGRAGELCGRSVLLAATDQLAAALALIELDGTAARIVLCPPDLSAAHVDFVIARAAIDAVVADRPEPTLTEARAGCFIACRPALVPAAPQSGPRAATEWILLTSGTTGLPKLVVHTLASLAAPIAAGDAAAPMPVWSTFYDIRRYGGLQILLRALVGGGSMVLGGVGESVGDFLTRAGRCGVTHISGTPSHWRRGLMSPAARRINPRYVRLSGEIADQAILDRLHAFYPTAEIAHAFASTEAGVAFTVGDGLAGFPARLIGQAGGEVELAIVDGSLRIRSNRTARGYLGGDEALAGSDGFVDTGDMIERRGERCHFVGRRGGIINVGGRKVHPEEVEAALNRHPAVHIALAKARKSPITGAVVAADVVLQKGADDDAEALRRDILAACRRELAPHKVPAVIRFVPSLAISGAGKLARRDA